MKEVILNVPEERADEFTARLAALMQECGATMKFQPKDGDFVAFEDDTTEKPFIGIFKSWYADTRDKIECYAHIDDKGELEEEEEYWNADTIRLATEEEKAQLERCLLNARKRWNPEEKCFETCEKYESIKTFDDACDAVRKMAFNGDALADLLLKDLEFNSPRTPDLLAFIKLRIIAHAINDGWTPKFVVGEYRYYPWFYLYTQEEIDRMDEEERSKLLRVGGRANDGARCGLSYATSCNAFSISSADFGARLAFYDERRAKYAGTKFLELYRDLNFLPPTDEGKE